VPVGLVDIALKAV